MDSSVDQILGSGQTTQPQETVDSILGTAPTKADQSIGSQDDNGMCQRFVEKVVYGKTGIFPTATDAANAYQQEGKLNPDISKAPTGSLIYFAPDASNGDAGHVGIMDDKNNMISATYNGVQKSNVHDWIKQTGQVPVGFVDVGGASK